MPAETAEQIKQLLTLQSKTIIELRAICEGLGFSHKGSHNELIERLLSSKNSPQSDVTKPQAIPLRTRDEHQKILIGAKETFLYWRKLIFENGKYKQFTLLNNQGEPYRVKLKYIKCNLQIAHHIIDERWFLPLDHQKDLINLLKVDNIINIDLSIIQKPTSNKRSWLMLHIMAKEAA